MTRVRFALTRVHTGYIPVFHQENKQYNCTLYGASTGRRIKTNKRKRTKRTRRRRRRQQRRR